MTLFTESLQAVFLVAIFLACCLGAGAPIARILGLPGAFVFPAGFAGVSLAGYLVFFAWWLHPGFGLAASAVAGLGGIALFAAQAAAHGSSIRRDARAVWVPVLLLVLIGAAYALLLLA
ncbi:MAG TPA: hypothetical protein VIK52_09345, partial [Opitutaceae bacterium]